MSLFTDLKEVLTPYANRIKGLSEDVEEIRNDMANIGISDNIKKVLIDCFRNVSWNDERGEESYEELKNILGYYDQYEWSLSNGLLLKRIGGITGNDNHLVCLDTGINRRVFGCNDGVLPYFEHDTDTPLTLYPIPVPLDAISASITITPNTQCFYASTRTLVDNNTNYSAGIEAIGYVAGTGTLNISQNGTRKFITILTKYNTSGGSYLTEPSNLHIVFNKRGV